MLMNLWSGNHSMCSVFPKFLIVGPQKTGLIENKTMTVHRIKNNVTIV